MKHLALLLRGWKAPIFCVLLVLIYWRLSGWL